MENSETARELHRLASRVHGVLGGLRNDAMDAMRPSTRSGGGIAFFTLMNACCSNLGELCGQSWHLLETLKATRSRLAGLVDETVLDQEESRWHAVHFLMPTERRPQLTRLRSDVITSGEMNEQCLEVACRATRGIMEWCRSVLRYHDDSPRTTNEFQPVGPGSVADSSYCIDSPETSDEEIYPSRNHPSSARGYNHRTSSRMNQQPQYEPRYERPFLDTRPPFDSGGYSRFTDVLDTSPRSAEARNRNRSQWNDHSRPIVANNRHNNHNRQRYASDQRRFRRSNEAETPSSHSSHNTASDDDFHYPYGYMRP
eukprot:Protomagalhaensia_sp_Gyna_25__939@NODE_1451_length_1824_cov_9_170868_g1174_i0_p1_GENE_NODE_1451_length_1824_cov_9_170868_g1174_i0NODE_1451_length_1824_cov_9_170868_g1174_i0_p1_ORF_typecomplete_len313_score27_51_NODE_1451_length_1824_cov_9_170868_g1174_i07991737